MSRTFVPPSQPISQLASFQDLYQYAHVERDSSPEYFRDLENRVVAADSSANESVEFENSIVGDVLGPTSPFGGFSELESGEVHQEKIEDDEKYRYGLKIFLTVSIVSAVLVMALEIFMFVAINLNRHGFDTDSKYFEISIFLALFIFAGFYQVLITIVGLHTKNLILLSMLLVFYACMLIYTGIQYNELNQNETYEVALAWRRATMGTNIAALVVLALTLVVQTLLIVCVLRSSMRWFKFKKIGASFDIKRRYTVFQFHRCLLMFDFFFFLAFTVQFIVIMVADKTSVEFILTCCMLPLTILVLFASDYAATRELVWLSVFTVLCYIGGCVYVLFKTIRLFTKYTSAYDVTLVPGSYFPGRTSLVFFAVVTLVFLVCTIVLECWTVFNYNKGLLPFVNTYYPGLPLAGRPGVSQPAIFDDEPEKSAETESMMID